MIDPRFLAEIKARISLSELMAPGLTKLKRRGNGDWSALCPFHRERTGSFYIVEKKAFWHCFGCGEHGDCFAWIMKTTNAREFPEAVEYLAAKAGLRSSGPLLEAKPIVQRPGEAAVKAERDKKIRNARRIWHEAGPIMLPSAIKTPAELYLRGRGLRVALPPSLRFQPRLAHPHDPRRRLFPALVAGVQGPDRDIVGVHCTYLEMHYGHWVKMNAPSGIDDPADWKPKIMRGACWGGAVRLTAAEDVIVLAEGIETALSVLQALHDDEIGAPHIDGEPVAVWAALSLGNLGAVMLPDGVREVILAGDGDGKVPEDKPGIAQKDPDELLDLAAARHREQGRNVRIARPPKGSDFNDLLPPGAGAGSGADADIAA